MLGLYRFLIMKNFEHECNGKVNDSSSEEKKCCNNCNCDENDINDAPCDCACHDN